MAFIPQIPGRETHELNGFVPVSRGECRIDLFQGARDYLSDGRLQFLPQFSGLRLSAHVAHPLVPGPQHDAQQPFDPSHMVVQMRQEFRQGFRYICGRALGVQRGDRQAGSPVIQVSGIVDRVKCRAHAGDPGHLPDQHGAQRIDRLYPKARRMLGQSPVERVVPFLGGSRESPGMPFMGRCRLGTVGALEGGDDPVAHLRGRLPRKGDGNDGFGPVHPGQQRQETLDKQFSLTGSRRGLHDKRPVGVQGKHTLFLVPRRIKHRHPPTRRIPGLYGKGTAARSTGRSDSGPWDRRSPIPI